MIRPELDELDDGRHMLEKAGCEVCHHDAMPSGSPEVNVPTGRCHHDPESPKSHESKVGNCHHSKPP